MACIERWKARQGLTWDVVAQQLGYSSAPALFKLKRRPTITEPVAARVLRAMAGEPRPPSGYELLLAERARPHRKTRTP